MDLESRLDILIGLLRQHLGSTPTPTDWSCHAFRWQCPPGKPGFMVGIPHVAHISPKDLLGIDRQKFLLHQNIEQFVAKLPFNHVLLTGARGTGKSSLVRSLLTLYAQQGLRLVEIEREHLMDLPVIVELLRPRPEHFILFCDDLSFAEHEFDYRALKVVLDGTVQASAPNVLILATSNRRHLLPRRMTENLATQHEDGEIRPEETTDEKISLSDRFGLWLSFHPQDQNAYLECAQHWLEKLGGTWTEECQQAALRYALERSHRSGRSAWHFAQHWAGSVQLKALNPQSSMN